MLETEHQFPPEVDSPDLLRNGRRMHVLDVLIIWAGYRRQILVATAVATGLGILASLLLPSIYRANTKLLPPQQNQSFASVMLGQLAPLANLAGRDLGLKNPNDVYIGILQSRSLADALIGRFHLQERYRART